MNNDTPHPAVSRAEWTKARLALLEKEKQFTRLKDELCAERQRLPWLAVEKEYVFDGESGPVKLSELFAGRSQLIIYHFMFAPEWSQGCPSCSFVADHYAPAIIHLENHDVSFVTVARAPLDTIRAFKKRMGWSFRWVSSNGNDFNRDFKVSFTEKEISSRLRLYNHETQEAGLSDVPGLSVFHRGDDGSIHLTYSTFARGLDIFLNAYNFLEVTPKGRNEKTGMEWVQHHDTYGKGKREQPWEETTVNSVRE